jgi:type VI protein secretion system component Hcp
MPLARTALGIGDLLLLAAMANPARAAADYYLKIDGIDGTSGDRGHEGWIEAIGITWETGWTRGVAGCAPVKECDAAIVRSIDQDSAKLTEVMRSGRLIPSLTLHFVRAGAVTGTGTLRNVLIVSYRKAEGERPSEQITVIFDRVEWSGEGKIAPTKQ